ncbi:hypothetical protein [Weissella paramesenteroides]|uniref:Uncharacterized protein n=1 Tax=Weissella paramesenteroides TaxID=1249 RepID=A0ABD4XHF5_WEIPA|nr:hypothetical protein [Weissella paramesenteroides]KAA8446531.1 hypothetical protein FKV72_01755 [Weissella paramesenteroides]KAA8454573.1 hypothetical protein FKV71_02025 [Weissella paramesenteroides]MDF8367245.1 hypothetical protein [Weissella paramesenteroides]MDF8368870.1 hypothetical protein [Weissella paramesenteroides]MDF8370739.1 hypothetical protein [Weissella paramesenteroides]
MELKYIETVVNIHAFYTSEINYMLQHHWLLLGTWDDNGVPNTYDKLFVDTDVKADRSNFESSGLQLTFGTTLANAQKTIEYFGDDFFEKVHGLRPNDFK